MVFQQYSGREQLQQNINAIKKWGRDGPTGQRLLTCTGIVCKFGMEDRFSYCSAYNVSTLYQNIQNMSLKCRERGPLQTHYPLWSTVRFSVF